MVAVNHSERAHALLSASSSHRWLVCTPSAKAENIFLKELEAQGKKDESEYAKEGTAAHEYSELILNRELGNLTKAQATRRINKFKKENEQYYNEEMEEAIGIYSDYVLEKVNEARSETPDAQVIIEQRLDYSQWAPEGFGTGDVLIIRDGIMEIIDLKYGKGVPVDAYENSQLKLYGLGALAEFDILYDIHTVRLTIVQPRLDNISTFEISTQDLYEWAENVVKPKAELAYRGEGEYVPGEHCRFCKIRATCRARAEQALEVAKAEFSDDGSIEVVLPEPATLSNKEIAEILFVVKDVEKWCKDIQNYALEKALEGEKFEGFKLVEGRSNRMITDEDKAAQLLKAHLQGKGCEDPEKIIYTKKLAGITTLEKAIGKKTFAELLNGLIEKPPGNPVLVTLDDKRPELQSEESAKADFAGEV